jgi:serine/threonine protein kinase/putative intracellular protease/amidase
MNAQQTAHPSPEQLAAFGRGRLSPAERAAVEQHVAGCSTCCQALQQVPNDTLMNLARKAAKAPPSSIPLGETVAIAGDTTPPAAAPDLVAPGSPELPSELAEHPTYRIISLFGIGGMGAVYKAEHRILERTVALKVINREFLKGHAQAVERFRLEVKAAGKLGHPNIVQAHDAGQAGDLHFLVMEYVEGISLARLVEKKGPLSVGHACHFIRQAALGLQHAFEKGMVHRDIKPQNLMLTRKGQVKVLDFGLARFASEQQLKVAEPQGLPMPPEVDDSGTAPLTTPGLVLGTPDYIAPEQARCPSEADIRADIYSLGCTLYYLLTGRPPFADSTAFEKLLAHMQAEPVPLTERRPDVPPDLAAVVIQMMAKEPGHRFQTPAEVARALAPFARLDGSVSTVEAAPTPVPEAAPEEEPAPAPVPVRKSKRKPRRPKPKDRRRLLIVGVATAAALLLLAAGWWAVSTWKNQPTQAGPVAGAGTPRVLMVLPFKGYWVPDYEPVHRVLKEGGAKVTIASTSPGKVPPLRWGPPGDPVPVDVTIGNVNPKDYDALVFVGGDMSDIPSSFSTIRPVIRGMQESGKCVAGICRGIGPLLMADALRGKKAAQSEELQDKVNDPSHGVTWINQPVVTDGKVITAKNPEAAEAFARALLESLRQAR